MIVQNVTNRHRYFVIADWERRDLGVIGLVRYACSLKARFLGALYPRSSKKKFSEAEFR